MKLVVLAALGVAAVGVAQVYHKATFKQRTAKPVAYQMTPTLVPEAVPPPRYSQRTVPPATYQTLLFKSSYDYSRLRNRKLWI